MTKRNISLTTILCLIGLAALPISLRAQSGDWQTFSPEGEEFSVMMPKDTKSEDGQETYHRMTLTTRLYLSQAAKGPVAAVASMNGIKANSAMYTELQRLNSYVDAFKSWFPSKVAAKDTVAKMTLVGDKLVNGNNGREYKLSIGDLSGTAQVFVTRRRFYAVVLLNTGKQDELAQKFFSSLTLPEKATQAQVNANAMTAEKPVSPEGVPSQKPARAEGADDSQKPGAAAASPSVETKPAENPPAEKAAGEAATISGGLLNGKALYLPQPEYPPVAMAAKASGTVNVQVLIDEYGNVVSAHAINGHPLLQAASVAAARLARFSQTMLSGVPVKVNGVISYSFVAQ